MYRILGNANFMLNGRYTEFTENNASTSLYNLSYLTIINVEGEKAAEFLQGQLTADIKKVTKETIRQSALCNLQGRIIALIDIVYWNGFKLILPSDLCPLVIKSLTMVAKLSKVSLQRSTEYNIYGFVGKMESIGEHRLPKCKNHCTHNDTFFAYALDEESCILLTSATYTETQSSLSWHRHQLANNRIEVYPQSQGMFLPHRLDLHLSGHLDFEKGCYKGQEIIARIHYRSQQKHHLRLFLIQTATLLSPGMKLLDPANKREVGELIDFCPLEKSNYLICVSILFEHPETVLIEGELISLVTFDVKHHLYP